MSRVLFCIPSKRLSGPNIAMLNLARGLAKKKVDVVIICSEPPSKFKNFFLEAESDGVTLIKARHFDNNFLYWISLALKSLRSMGDSTIVQLHDIRTCSFIGPLARLFRKSVILTMGGDPDLEAELYRIGGLKRLQVKAQWAVSIKVANRICPCSKWLALSITDNRPSIFRKVTPMHYPIRVVGGKAIREGNFIVSAARLHYVKGIDVLVKAMREVVNSLPRAKLIVCGEGEERSKLEELSKGLGLSGNISFVGFQSNVERYIKAGLFLVLPSRYEPMGMVFLEAASYGKPVVASNVGGIPEVVLGGETGLLVPPDDPEALAGAIIELLSDSNYRKTLGKKGREWAARFYPERVAEDYLKIYGEISKSFIHK